MTLAALGVVKDVFCSYEIRHHFQSMFPFEGLAEFKTTAVQIRLSA